jgi:16S rRNA (cytidine1402-2'-O)-methyltransferase
LFVVATPIGNLEDLSPRARRVLAGVAVIAAEDTRHARILLEHIGVRTPLVSYHDHNEQQRAPALIERLEQGDDVALVTDAGVPGVSDPGFRLTRAAHEAGIRVVGIPGACAAITALSIAGLPTDRFLFLGFLPPRQARRRAALAAVREEPGTLVIYESPQRIRETLIDVEAVLPGREVALGRELTKAHEEVLRGMPAEVIARLEANEQDKLRGEMTLLVAGAGRKGRVETAGRGLEPGAGLKQLADEVASILGVPRREAYKALSRLKSEHSGGTEEA